MTVLQICVTYRQTTTDHCFVNHFTYTYTDGKKNKVNIFNIFIENCLPQIGL